MKLQQPFYIEKRTLPNSHLDLNGMWDFCQLDETTDEIGKLTFEYSASIPNNTYFNLYDAGILPHPYEGINCLDYKFVDQKIWYYRRKFTLCEGNNLGKAFLCFDGVGYYSRVWINGIEIGEHEGLFGGPIVEVSNQLNFSGENELIVEVKSCNYGIPDEEWKDIYRSPKKPYLVPWNMIKDTNTSNGCFTVMGIYNDVRLEFVPALHISRPYLTTESASEEKAMLHISAEIVPEDLDELNVPMHDTVGNGYVYGYTRGMNVEYTDIVVDIELAITEKATNKKVFSNSYKQTLYDSSKIGINTKYNEAQFFEQDIEIEAPRLWYPLGLGSPELYNIELTLYLDGKKLDYHTFDYGIRTFRLEYGAGRRMRTRWGKYKCVVNGKAFFMKGMNWTPLDFLLSQKEKDYRWALQLARDENIQLIRVWGAGNAPEHDDFYRLCDEYGIMVWQDSFISNHSNPLWDKSLFMAQQCMYIYRIRNHPSLVIHCSGNENNPYAEENHCVSVWQQSVEDLDPSREMIRTTPDKGSAHIYHGFEPCWFRKMYNQLPLIGESGTHSFPSAKSFRQLICKEEYNLPIQSFGSEEMLESHKELVNHITENDTWGMLKKIPALSHICKIENNSVAQLCEASGMASYEYYQFMVQAMRENYPIACGIMPWVFKRPWTTVATQMVDGLGDPVAPYYAVKNAYKPLAIHIALKELVYSIGEEIELDARIINESYKDRNVVAKVTIYSPELKAVYEKQTSLNLSADEYQTKLPIEKFAIPNDFNDKFFFIKASLLEEGEEISQSFYWPVVMSCMQDENFKKERREQTDFKALTHTDGPWLMSQLENGEKADIDFCVFDVEYVKDRINGKITLKNNSNIPAFPVHICFENDGLLQNLEDDFFCLDGNSEKTLTFTIRNDSEKIVDLDVSLSAWNIENKNLLIKGEDCCCE